MSTSLVRLCRRLVAIAAVSVAAVSAIGTATPAAATPAAPPYERPIDASDGVVVDPFRAPPGPYAAGNRGIDYATLVERILDSARLHA